MPSTTGSVLNRAISLSIGSAVIMIVLGVFAIALPGASGIGVAILVAWLAILAGIVHLVYAFAGETAGRVLWRVLVGLVYIAAGVYLAAQPALSLVSLTLVLGALFVAEAVLRVITFFQLRSLHGSGWILFDAGVTLLLGFAILAGWPGDSAWAVGTLFGVNLLFSGFARLMLSMSARRALHAFASADSG